MNNNKRATKRALLTSVMALVMCVVMLVGTTFAWFTDTASTGVNKIQAGNLKVSLVDGEGNDLTGKSIKWAAKDGREQEEIFWEPGAKYKTEQFYIRNDGNLALKYKVSVNGFTGNTELLDVLEFSFLLSGDTVPGGMKAFNSLDALNNYEGYLLPASEGISTDTVTTNPENVGIKITAKMKESAGNKYQGMSLDGIGITVVATQYTYESDSFGKNYDEGAEYPATVSTAADLKAALAAGKDVILTESIALTEPLSIKKDVTITGNGYAVISDYPVYVDPAAEVTFDGVNFATPDNKNSNASSVYASGLKGKVVFDGCTFTNPQWECIQITPVDGAEIVVTNCTFIVDGTGTYAHGDKVERMLHIQNTAATGDYKVTVTNNKFVGVNKVRNSVIDIDDIAAFSNVICGGNSFANADGALVSTLEDGKIYVNLKGGYSGKYVATDTYKQFTRSPAAALQH